MSATAMISKPTSSSLRRDDDAATTPLTMAAEANMFVKLHVKDGCGKGVVIPLKDLLAKSENTHTASYSTLRRFALAALFKHEDIPEYAHENFQTCFTCTHHTSDSGGTGTQTLMRNDNDLTIVLEEASADRLMDDNDNIVVDIHCTFVNTFKFDKGEMFRESATAAADNAKKAMKTWFEKASSLFQRFVTDGEDYVVVSKNKGHNKDNVHPAEWASRFVQFLFTERVPSQQHQKKKKQQQTRAGCTVRPTVRVHNKKQQLAAPQVHKANSLETAEDMVDVAIVGFNMATEIFNEAILRHEDAVRNFFHTRKMKRANKNKEACQISSSSNNNDSSVSSSSSKASLPSVTSPVDISRDDSEVEGEEEEEEEFNLDRGVEIEFDPENESNELTEDEWKIFFTNSTEEVEEEESGAVLLDVPSEQDVVSISSSDESTECQQSAAASMSNDSDDDSWALLDDDE